MLNASSEAGATPDGMFRLLVRAADRPDPGARSIELHGRRWVLAEQAGAPGAQNAPEYTCVSYAWGRGRAENPFDERLPMSDRTRAALEATISALEPTAVWIDALCVPFDEPARTACLLSMGAIYSAAAQVVVVLSPSCADLLAQIDSAGHIDEATLHTFEEDEWVTRAWTYQEVVNSAALHFVVEGGSAVAVRGDQLLNSVGQAIADYKKAHSYDSFTLRGLRPRLDSLEDLIADWLTADYLERSAYQVMSAMDRRRSERPDDHFYAMVGAITTAARDDRDTPMLHPAEHFMRICEAKGDYSFIYSSAPRSEIPGRCWRPVAGPIHAILPWHSFGEGQSGALYPTHIQLDHMCHMSPGSVSLAAQHFVETWLQSDHAVSEAGAIPARILRRLSAAGFSGCGEHLELESGYFFPQTPLPDDPDILAVIARGVQWVHGAPGLLLRGDGSDIYHCCGVGVFVGPLPLVGESINVGKASSMLGLRVR